MSRDESREQWTLKIETWKSSGISVKAWCVQTETNYHTLRYWMQKLNKEKLVTGNANTMTWSTFRMTNDRASANVTEESIKVHIGSTILEIPLTTPLKTIECIVDALLRTC
jgi:hypothetical protein